VLLLMVCAVLAAASPASAHSLVERSSPPANSALDVAPRQVVLWFNEPVDPAFSTATVTDPAGRRVSDRAMVASDGRRMTVPLQQIGRGFYTVRWRVLSAVDGHTTGGAFAFTVGLGARPPDSFGGTSAPDRGLALIRWIGLAAALLLAGALWFPALVLGPGLRRIAPDEARGLGDDAGRRLRRLVVAAATVVLASAAVEIVFRVTVLAEASVGEALAGGLLTTMVWTTKPGWSALARICMAVLALLPLSLRGHLLRAGGLFWFVLVTGVLALLGGPSGLSGSGHLALLVLVGAVYGLAMIMMAIILPQVADFRMPDLAPVPVILGALTLGGLTINSHAWGSGALATLVDWIHLGAVAAWIGGLAALMVVAAGERGDNRLRLTRALVPAMSRVAALSLAALVVTGIYSAWLHVPGLGALSITEYGRYLLAKLGLILPLVALGAINRFVLMPRLATAHAGAARCLPQAAPHAAPQAARPAAASSEQTILVVLGGEIGFGLAVLLVVALLTATPPARVSLATSTAAASALRYAGISQDVRLALTVSPAQPGPNQIEIMATRPDGQPVAEESRALLRLWKLDEDLAPTTITLEAQGDGRYAAPGGVTIPAGWWETEVVLRRRGRLDAVASFPLRIGQTTASATDPAAARLLEAAATVMTSLRAWREVEQITDGAGGVVVAHVELVRPDRMRIVTSAGAEAVVIGATRWLRAPAGWRQETLARPIAAEGAVQYLRGAEAIAGGRPASCEGEPCRVVLWEAPGRAAAFAGWIGADSRRIHKILMVAPQHYMTGHLGEFNGPIRVEAPR
jgi:copper transport protein